MIIREGISRALRLYFIAFTGWNKKRKGYRYPDAILALKKLNYIFAKYTFIRFFSFKVLLVVYNVYDYCYICGTFLIRALLA